MLWVMVAGQNKKPKSVQENNRYVESLFEMLGARLWYMLLYHYSYWHHWQGVVFGIKPQPPANYLAVSYLMLHVRPTWSYWHTYLYFVHRVIWPWKLHTWLPLDNPFEWCCHREASVNQNQQHAVHETGTAKNNKEILPNAALILREVTVIANPMVCSMKYWSFITFVECNSSTSIPESSIASKNAWSTVIFVVIATTNTLLFYVANLHYCTGSRWFWHTKCFFVVFAKTTIG